VLKSSFRKLSKALSCHLESELLKTLLKKILNISQLIKSFSSTELRMSKLFKCRSLTTKNGSQTLSSMLSSMTQTPPNWMPTKSMTPRLESRLLMRTSQVLLDLKTLKSLFKIIENTLRLILREQMVQMERFHVLLELWYPMDQALLLLWLLKMNTMYQSTKKLNSLMLRPRNKLESH